MAKPKRKVRIEARGDTVFVVFCDRKKGQRYIAHQFHQASVAYVKAFVISRNKYQIEE